MRRIFLLSGDHPLMAVDEIIAITRKHPLFQSGSLVIIDTPLSRLADRLAYTRAVYRFLFKCPEADLVKGVGAIRWSALVKGSLAVRFPGNRGLEGRLAAIILSNLKDPVVDLRSPAVSIEFFSADGEILCGILEGKNPGGFDDRKAHRRIAPHPSSMHPKLCRWFANRTGIRKGTLVDPFCGSGGILLEAGLIGLDVEGYDIVPAMISRAKENLSVINKKMVSVSLSCQDALMINKPLRFVATDLPYGRATRASPLLPLYDGFLSLLARRLVGRAVIGYPDWIDLKGMAQKKGLDVAGYYEYYLHRSLTKRIIVVEPKRVP